MAYTTPRTWVAGETVTAALLNTHVRDNLDYLKGVLTDVSNQDVTINAARSLLCGTQQVMRAAAGTKQHVEGGRATISGTVTGNGNGTVGVTFAKAFSATPGITVSINAATGRDPSDFRCNVTSAGTTGFTATVELVGAGDATSVVVGWTAVGND
jgi:ribosomal protein S5